MNRKYAGWPLNPKSPHFDAQRCHHCCHQQPQRGALAPVKASFRGSGPDPVCSRCRQHNPVGPPNTHIQLGVRNKANQCKNDNQIRILCRPCVFARPSCGPLPASVTALLKHSRSRPGCSPPGGYPATGEAVDVFWQLEKGKLTLHQH